MKRSRHQHIVKELDRIGVKINFITDGDIAGGLSVIGENSQNDIYLGTGGGPEGVIVAAALSCLGGQIQGRLILDAKETVRAKKLGITEFEKKTLIIDTQKDLKNKLLNIQDPISRNIDAAILQEKLKIEIIILEDPLQVKFDTMQKNRNIKICDSYGFIRETDKYFECLLILIEIDTNRNFFIK